MVEYFCKGKLVQLRDVTPDDAPLILKWKNDPLVRKMAIGKSSTINLKEQLEDIKQAVESSRQVYYIIEVSETDRAVGYIRINWMDEDRRFGWLRLAMGEQRGKGYMKDALNALLTKLFAESLHRMDAEVYDFNEACLNMLKKIGFVVEGIKREAHYDDDRYFNVVTLGLIRTDFMAGE